MQLCGQGVCLTIQCGIGQLTTVADQGHRLGLTQHLSHKALHHVLRRHRGLWRFNPRLWQPNVADQALRIQRQLRQQTFELRANVFHLRRAEAFAQVQVFHLQALIGGADHQVHREVGHPAAADFGKFQLAVLLTAQGTVHRVVFKHDNAVEQPLAALPGPTLNIRQRGVLKVTDRQVVSL